MDLSSAELQDKFETRGVGVVTLGLMVEDWFCFKTELGELFVTNNEGLHSDLSDDPRDIMCEHDERPWLEDMPPAWVFDDDYLVWSKSGFLTVREWHTCNTGNVRSGNSAVIHGVRMPHMVGKGGDVVISVNELAEWQKENK